eukprot:6210919-Pleurochrysis_carterae.AAC.1
MATNERVAASAAKKRLQPSQRTARRETGKALPIRPSIKPALRPTRVQSLSASYRSLDSACDIVQSRG